jgi:hypothetical protein
MRKVIVILLVIISILVADTTYAMDMLHALTHEMQYSLALGEVIEINDSSAKIRIEEIVSGKSLPDVISIDIPGDFLPEYEPELKTKDYVVVSIDKEGENYSVLMGYYKVTGLEMEKLEIISGPLPAGDLAALQWYINSGGKENDFYFIGTNAYVRNSDGSEKMIYPMEKDIPTPTEVEQIAENIKPIDEDKIVSEVSSQRWNSAQLTGIIFISVIGTVVLIIILRRKTAG